MFAPCGSDLSANLTHMSTAGLGSEAVARETRESVIDCLEKISVSLRPYTPLGGLSAQDPLSGELRGCVTAYITAIRGSGVPPETSLVLLKQMMRDHLHLGDESLKAIGEEVTRWAIDAYYRPSAMMK